MQNDDFMMTEEDWLRLPNPLEFVRKTQGADRTKLGRRQLRLFACGCCRKFWSQLSTESREAIEIAERYADQES